MKMSEMNARLANVSAEQIERVKKMIKEGNGGATIVFESALSAKEVNAVFALVEMEKIVDGEVAKVETIKRGEFVRRKADAVKTYQRGEYDKSSKTYSLVDCDDMNREVFVKRGTVLFVGFTY